MSSENTKNGTDKINKKNNTIKEKINTYTIDYIDGTSEIVTKIDLIKVLKKRLK